MYAGFTYGFSGSLLDTLLVYHERSQFEEFEAKMGICLCVLAHLKDGDGQLHMLLLTAGTLYLLVTQSHIINQKGATSGFEMCFGTSTFGAGPNARLESSIEKFKPHVMYVFFRSTIWKQRRRRLLTRWMLRTSRDLSTTRHIRTTWRF